MALDTSFDLKKISMRELVIMGVTLFSAIGYGYYEFEYSVQQKKITKITQEIKEVRTSLGTLQKLLVNPKKVEKTKADIERIEGELSDLKGDIEKVKSRLKGQELEILDKLQNEAEYNGVILKSMRSSEKLVKRGSLKLKEVSLFMDMEAEFDGLKNFIDSLGTISAVIEIESLETKRNEKILPKVESKLHLKVIVL
jgi:septal ring factor EnvC (AmiA/AmiB activator)